MYSFYKSTITHAHQQVIFSYEVLLYTKEEEQKMGYRLGPILKKDWLPTIHSFMHTFIQLLSY